MNMLAAVFAAAAIALIGYMFWKYARAVRGEDAPSSRPPMRFHPIHRCTRRDALIALIITAAYALVGFSNLGDTRAPQSFYRLTAESPTLTIDLGETRTLGGIFYYTGSFHDVYGNYKGYDLELSDDGSTFHPYGILEQTHANTFHWVDRTFDEDDLTEYGIPAARYVRLTAHTFPMELGELCILDENGAPLDPTAFKTSPVDARGKLFDEQSLKPEESTYKNSMYFDEIYHARTAREFLNGEKVYENTHPPLGKSIISLGIALFGMTPFGWRFMGVLFGVLMLPFCYVLIKNMFGKTWLAACGTLIFAFDFMHYVQTRIATIDTYGLFFTILMYFFMYRFLAAGYDSPARTRLVPLALCGVSFGLGIASKWTCFYAAAGLVVLYVIGAVCEGKRLAAEGRAREFAKKFAAVIGVSVIFFVVVGFGIYALSYIPFARGNGREFNFATIWANQTSMFDYHSKLVATHSYQSSWWQWLVDGRPILYFRKYRGSDTAGFASFNSPLVAWAGLLAMIALIISLYRGSSTNAKRVGVFFALCTFFGFAAQIVTFIASNFEKFTNQQFNYMFSAGMVGAVVAPFAAQFIKNRLDARRAVPDPKSDLTDPAAPARSESTSDSSHALRAPEYTPLRSTSLFIIIGALAQLLSWTLVTRCTFAYHYFPTSFFLVLALAAVFNRWDATGVRAEASTPTGFAKQNRGQSRTPAKGGVQRGTAAPLGKRSDSPFRAGTQGQRVCIVFTAACVLLFALYYPALTGLYAPNWYHSLVKWFPSWVV